VQLWNNGSRPESKRLIFEVLKQAPQDAQARDLLRSAVSNQVRGGTDDFANRFEQAFMSDPNSIIQHAAKGWLYSLTLDQAFIDPSLERRSLPPKRKPKSPPVTQTDMGSADEILLQLLLLDDPRERWKAVLDLASSNERVVVEDSFASVEDAELHDRLAGSLRNEGLNIVIIGGGIMGVAMANALKMGFGDQIDILVIESRIQGPHVKEPYSRHWLTHIGNDLIQGVYDPLVSQLLVEFGNGKYIGGTLAVIETLLLVSNKKLGVRFLFKDDYDLSFIDDSDTSLVIDASGGRFRAEPDAYREGAYSVPSNELEITLPEVSGYGRGYAKHGITNFSDVPATKINLQREGDRFVPYRNGTRIRSAMFKVTHLPLGLHDSLMEFVKENNEDCQFYIWPGNLRPELNEILTLINVTKAEYEELAPAVRETTSLARFFENGGLERVAASPRIASFLRLIADSGSDLTKISIEPPFFYSPYSRLMSGTLGRLYGRPLVPIGDGVFIGHPNVGNGLGVHLRIVRTIHDLAMLMYGD